MSSNNEQLKELQIENEEVKVGKASSLKVKINSEESLVLEPLQNPDEAQPHPTLIYSNLIPESDDIKRKRRSTVKMQRLSVLGRHVNLTVTCNNCHNKVTTLTKTTYPVEVYGWFFFFFFCGATLCSWIPFVLTDLKQIKHVCPECKTKLASYKLQLRLKTKFLLALLSALCVSTILFLLLYWAEVLSL